jgi:glycosyltransferase involved in cell wall biosynthesis
MTRAQPRRILITTSTFPRDEQDPVTARFILDLALRLASHVEVVVLAPAVPGVPTRERWGELTVVRYRYFVPERLQRVTTGEGMLAATRRSALARAQVPFFFGAQLAALPHIVRAERIDLVNAHWVVPQGLVAAQWRRALKVPVVVTAHGTDGRMLARAPLGRAVARYVLDRADHLHAASRHLAAELERLVGRAVPHAVIPMGVSTERFAPLGEAAPVRRTAGERVVLFVGKLVATKGVFVVLEAFARLRAERVPARLVMIGGGPEEQAIRARVTELGLEGCVELRGWVRNADLPAWYRAADVVCVPSTRDSHGDTEGTPVVLLEALATGVPVVASRMSGIPDVLQDGRNGWLVPPGDADALAGALRRALALDEPSRADIRLSAIETAREHRWERVTERYLEGYALAADRARLRGGETLVR